MKVTCLHVSKGIPENKDPGVWRTLEEPGPYRTQDPRWLRTQGDECPYIEKYWLLTLLWNIYIYIYFTIWKIFEIYIYIYIRYSGEKTKTTFLKNISTCCLLQFSRQKIHIMHDVMWKNQDYFLSKNVALGVPRLKRPPLKFLFCNITFV